MIIITTTAKTVVIIVIVVVVVVVVVAAAAVVAVVAVVVVVVVQKKLREVKRMKANCYILPHVICTNFSSDTIVYLQALLTDLAANSQVVDNINKMADQMIAEGHQETPYIKERRDEINSK